MAKVNLKGGSKPESYQALPTDFYVMQIRRVTLEDDQYADPNRDGSQPQQIVVNWEMHSLTPEQEQAGVTMAEGVREYYKPYYGPLKAGGPSRFQEFIDTIRGLGYLADFDIDDFDTDSLVGIVARLNVVEYTKSKGKYAGEKGNRVAAHLPVQRLGSSPRLIPARRNVPVAVNTNDPDLDIPF